MKKGIERTFLVKEVPSDLKAFEEKYVYQNYLSSTNKEELRIRLVIENGEKEYKVTFKRGGGMVREELGFLVAEETYQDLSNKIQFRPIEKDRKFYMLNPRKQVMVDTFEFADGTMKMAEVEFESEEEANDFVVPEWFGEEVTGDEQYKNKNLWKMLNKVA